MVMGLCKTCNVNKKLMRNGFCGTSCFNRSKAKGIDGYKNCLFCCKEFPFRKSLIARSAFSKKYNCMIGSINQKYCSKECSIKDRNLNHNPAKTESGKKKISESAIKRGTGHMHTKEAREKQKQSITGSGHWNWQNDKSHPNCIDCGVKITFNKKRCKKCDSKYRSAEKSPNWKGGVTPENKRLRKTIEYKEWRTSVFERDNYTCVMCLSRSSSGNKLEIHADHIKPFCNYPELRLDINNGRTLCAPCHRKTDTFGVNAQYY